MGKNIVITILAIMLAASVAGNVLLSVVLWGMITVNQMMGVGAGGSSLPFTVITPTYPAQAPPNQRFQLSFDVANTGQGIQQLHSIDVWGDGPQGLSQLQVHQVTPAYKRVENNGGFISYIWEKDIQPGQSLTVVFEVEASQVGMQQSYFDICIDNAFNTATQYVNIDIDANAPTPTLPAPASLSPTAPTTTGPPPAP